MLEYQFTPITSNGEYVILVTSDENIDVWNITHSPTIDGMGYINAYISDYTPNTCEIRIEVEGVDFEFEVPDATYIELMATTIDGAEESIYIDITFQGEYNPPYNPNPDPEPDPEPDFPEPDPEPEPDPDPEEPDIPSIVAGYLTASRKSITFQKDSSVVENLKIESDKELYEWVVKSHLYLNFETLSVDHWKVDFNLSLRTDNNSEKWINTEFTVIAYYNKEKTVSSEITIPIAIKGNKVIPIWRDEEYTQNVDGSVIFRIVNARTNEIVYAGNAKNYPNEDEIKIRVNKFVRGYLSSSFNEFGKKLNTLVNYSIPFNIMVDDYIVATYTIYNDWGYKNTDSIVISDPIRNVLDNRQYFVYSLYNRQDNSTNVEYMVDNNPYIVNVNSNNQSLLADDLSKYENVNTVQVGDKVFNVKPSCCDWCLYYVNAYGGWDSLLINGNDKKTDKITSSYYSKQYNNTTIEFEKVKYNNIINSTFELYTDWFTDEEQSKLYHLLESTEVYLQNLNTKELYPIVITNNSCEYKTYTNNGKKKFYNTITVELSQSKIRE